MACLDIDPGFRDVTIVAQSSKTLWPSCVCLTSVNASAQVNERKHAWRQVRRVSLSRANGLLETFHVRTQSGNSRRSRGSVEAMRD